MKLLLLFFGLVSITTITNAACPAKNMICYWSSWSVYRVDNGHFTQANIHPHLCTHLIYSFAGITEDGIIRSLDTWNDIDLGGYSKVVNLKSKNPCLKVLLAVGGWNEGSIKYSRMAKTETSRQKFADSALNFITLHGFDGLDVDWEYPAQNGGSPEDKQNFVLLLKTLKSTFSTKSKQKLLLSAAVPASVASTKISYDVLNMCQILDFVNLMAYDMHNLHKTSIHSPLKRESSDPSTTETIDNVINYYQKETCPLSKINLGIPFYGRSFILANPSSTNVGAQINGVGPAGPYTKENGFLGYNELCEYQKNQPGWRTQFLKENAAVYSWFNNLWVSYDNPESIAIKGKYVKDRGLGGLMFWAIETDDFKATCSPNQYYPLLTAAKKSLN